MDELEACAASNATCDVGSEVIKFPWPPEFSDALREIFAVMGIVSGPYLYIHIYSYHIKVPILHIPGCW